MRYLSVFSGVEAASVAWSQLGWQPVGFSEINPFCAEVLKSRYPGIPNYGDIRSHKEWPIPAGSVDLIVGGSPCQSFSRGGLRKGLDDHRGELATVYFELVGRILPKWIVWENVPEVLSSGGGRDFGSFIGKMGDIGYGYSWRVLDAKHFGVPQRRKRIYLVGYLGDWRPTAAVLFDGKGMLGDTNKVVQEWKDPSEIPGFSPEKSHGLIIPYRKSRSAMSRTDHEKWVYDEVSNCLTRSDLIGSEIRSRHAIVHNGLARKLTPLETERLQGYPDNYTKIAYNGKSAEECLDRYRYESMGNSFCVPVIRWIGERISQTQK